MNIAYVTAYDALDIRNWSGLAHMIARSLQTNGNQLDYIGNLSAHASRSMRIKKRLYKLLNAGIYDLERHPVVARQYAQQIQALLSPAADVIFSPGTIPISLLEAKAPKAFCTDATFAGMVGFYPEFSHLSQASITHGNYLERMALESSQLAIYSSEWAAKSAIDNYHVSPDKVKVVSFGANVEGNRNLGEIKSLVANRSKQECHLLFMGVDWYRKGGDTALAVAAELNLMGLKTTLHVAGLQHLPLKHVPDFVVNHGFISKTTLSGRNKIDRLFFQSHFLLLPTIADCTPVVFSEANAFGVPCISTNVGGIATVIKDDVNGKAFSLGASPSSYATYIHSMFSNGQSYKALALSSFNEYESRLNWNVAGKIISKLLGAL